MRSSRLAQATAAGWRPGRTRSRSEPGSSSTETLRGTGDGAAPAGTAERSGDSNGDSSEATSSARGAAIAGTLRGGAREGRGQGRAAPPAVAVCGWADPGRGFPVTTPPAMPGWLNGGAELGEERQRGHAPWETVVYQWDGHGVGAGRLLATPLKPRCIASHGRGMGRGLLHGHAPARSEAVRTPQTP